MKTKKAHNEANQCLEQEKKTLNLLKNEKILNAEALRVSQTLVADAQAKLDEGLSSTRSDAAVMVKAADELLKVGNKQLAEAIKKSNNLTQRKLDAEKRKRKAEESLESLMAKVGSSDA